MSPSSVARDRSNGTRWRVVAAAAALGGLAVVLGVPQFMAGLHLGPHDDTLRDIAAGKPVADARLARASESRDAALGWFASGRTFSELAILRFRTAAARPALGPARRAAVAEVIALQRRALELSPADAYGWTRLAQAHAVAAAPVGVVEPELRMAVARAPNESNLLEVRLNIALLYWGGLGVDARARTAADVRRAALWAPELLARLAHRRGLDADVSRMLEGHPLMAARFAYARTRLPARRR